MRLGHYIHLLSSPKLRPDLHPFALPILAEMIDGLGFILASNRFLCPLIFSLFKGRIRNINMRDRKKRGVVDPDRLPYALFERYQSWLGIRNFKAHESNNAPFVRNAAVLQERLEGESTATPSSSGYLHYPVIVQDRREALKEINDAGYDVGPGKFFNYGNQSCPRAGRAVKNNLNIPIHRFVNKSGLERMAGIIEAHQTEGPFK